MKKIEFSLKSYENLIKSILGNNFKIKSFKDYYKYKRVFIMRHDIDFCTNSALKIAKLENMLDVKATYFFLVNTSFYNIYSQEHYMNIKEILNLGHQIGLHFDISHYKECEFEKNCKREAKAFESLFGIKNHIISFHRPLKKLLNNNKKMAGYEHTYMPKYMNDMIYCSDSQGAWLYDTPERIIKRNLNKPELKVQLLTHPIWWDTKNYKTPQNKIRSFLKKRYDILKAEAKKNCKPYRKLKNE